MLDKKFRFTSWCERMEGSDEFGAIPQGFDQHILVYKVGPEPIVINGVK